MGTKINKPTTQSLQNIKIFQDHHNNRIDLPNYLEQLKFQKFPFFQQLNDLSYKTILEKHLVKIQEWDQPSINKVMHTKRVLAQVKIMQKTLPCQASNSIFVVVNEKNISQIKCLIFGSEDTPYQHGAFLYSINLLDTYPNEPPKVNLQTTGGHKIRFNPNLYQSGFVCLSLLGTWQGQQPKQNWQPNHSNISQVLLSIQTIVMNQNIYYNEPGFQYFDQNCSDDGFNIAYQNIVKFGNITYAMNQMLQNPPKFFQKVIKTHFYLKRNKILQSIYKWIEDTKVANYADLTFNHNPGIVFNKIVFCQRYSKPWFYKNDLIVKLQRLYINLSNIKIQDTYLPEQLQQKQTGKIFSTKILFPRQYFAFNSMLLYYKVYKKAQKVKNLRKLMSQKTKEKENEI